MRFALGGYLGSLLPMVIEYSYNSDNEGPFVKAGYIALGYTQFDVIAIGASGGRGGGVRFRYSSGGTDTDESTYGGGGGGGGSHRIQGLLSDLPDSTTVVLGVHGSDGAIDTTFDGTTASITTPDGGDGGVSSFDGTLCRASGGKGGKGFYDYAGGHTGQGGAGGVGNVATAGGGAAGGLRTPGTSLIAVAGSDGSWDGAIGQGGGGGSGGLHTLVSTDPTHPIAILGGVGGKGSYSSDDPTISNDGGVNTLGLPNLGGAVGLIIPGRGGGAQATPLNNKTTAWGGGDGDSFVDGAVILALS